MSDSKVSVTRSVLYGAIYQGLCRAVRVPPRGVKGSMANRRRQVMLPTINSHVLRILADIEARRCE